MLTATLLLPPPLLAFSLVVPDRPLSLLSLDHLDLDLAACPTLPGLARSPPPGPTTTTPLADL